MGNLHFAEGFAQNISMMQDYERNLVAAMERMYSSPTDNERFHANEEFLTLLDEIFHQPKSFHYPFDALNKISRITSSDKQFRIFTWSVVRENGEYEVFGYLQSKDPETGEYNVYRLIDKSEEMPVPEQQRCEVSEWYGCIYYDLIENKVKDRTYYTLLGWTGHNIYTQRKVIEILHFRNNGKKPVFGHQLFHKEKGTMRKVFEYSKDATMVLKFEKQPYKVSKRKRVSLFAKQKYKQVTETKYANMLVYEELEPIFHGMGGLLQYYAPSGVMKAYMFEDGKWRNVDNPMPRNPKTKYDDYDDQIPDRQHPFYTPEHNHLFPH